MIGTANIHTLIRSHVAICHLQIAIGATLPSARHPRFSLLGWALLVQTGNGCGLQRSILSTVHHSRWVLGVMALAGHRFKACVDGLH